MRSLGRLALTSTGWGGAAGFPMQRPWLMGEEGPEQVLVPISTSPWGVPLCLGATWILGSQPPPLNRASSSLSLFLD